MDLRRGQPVASIAQELRDLLGIDAGGKLPPVMVWRKAIAKSDLPPTTRHVLRALADHMSPEGVTCRRGPQEPPGPSVETLAADTGHDARTVRRHLRGSERGGWLAIQHSGGWNVNAYVATIPPDFEPGRRTRVHPQTRARVHRTGALVHQYPGAVSPQPGRSAPQGGTEEVREEVNEDDSRSAFDRFWQTYPRRSGRRKAGEAFGQAMERASAAVILDGARRYRDDPNRDPAYTANPTTWLDRDGWEDEPLPSRLPPGTRRAREIARMAREMKEDERRQLAVSRREAE